MTHDTDDFYEEDERVEDVVEAYEAGPHVVTEAPLQSCQVVTARNMLSFVNPGARSQTGQNRTPTLIQG